MLNFEQIKGQIVFLSQTWNNCRAKTVNSFWGSLDSKNLERMYGKIRLWTKRELRLEQI